MSDTDIAEVLEKAADDIAANGLAKNTLLNRQGQCCAIGAIGRAVGIQFDDTGAFERDDYDNPTVNAAVKYLAPRTGVPEWHYRWVSSWNCVVTWNNAPERTADDVIDAMRRAAKDLRNEATP